MRSLPTETAKRVKDLNEAVRKYANASSDHHPSGLSSANRVSDRISHQPLDVKTPLYCHVPAAHKEKRVTRAIWYDA